MFASGNISNCSVRTVSVAQLIAVISVSVTSAPGQLLQAVMGCGASNALKYKSAEEPTKADGSANGGPPPTPHKFESLKESKWNADPDHPILVKQVVTIKANESQREEDDETPALSEKEWAVLLENAKEINYEPEATVLAQGAQSNSLFVITDGRIRVVKDYGKYKVRQGMVSLQLL